jgi:UDP-2-acetamido-3-amino-2,3-dideoxy-glucuronate N-acetyltransferase
LAAVCDSDDAVEAVCSRDYSSVRYIAAFDDVLTDPAIKAVALATPAVTHFAMAKAAMLAGKDVFVEKPLALDVAEGEELVRLAADNRRVLMVGHILRYHPAVIKLQSLIRNGVLGRIQYVYSNRLNIGKIRTEEDILWSFAPHDVSAILGLLDEVPSTVSSQGGAYLSRQVYDVTLSHLSFPSGVQSHIFVSWLHPFKEQRLVVVGSEQMAVFDDTSGDKLVLYPHRVEWRNRVPTAVKADGVPVAIENREPLKAECEHFLDCITTRAIPVTSGAEGLRVLRILDACKRSLTQSGATIAMGGDASTASNLPYFVHESAYVDGGARVGNGTKIWHFSHVMNGATIGERCVIGQNVNIDGGAAIGNNVKIQNNVSVYSGVTVEDDVFLGPSCVLTNVINPRSQVNRRAIYEATTLRRGCTIGANATVVCGVTVGRYAFIAAGSVVTRDTPDYALMVGNPARNVGWMSRHGQRLNAADSSGVMRCPESGFRYHVDTGGQLRCLDLDENEPLPEELRTGKKPYQKLTTSLS